MRFTFLIRWALGAACTLVVIYFVSGIAVRSLYHALMLSLLLGLINAFIPHVLGAFSIASTIVTIGLAMLVANALLLYIAQSLQLGVVFESWRSLEIASVVIAVVTWFMSISIDSQLTAS